MKKNESIMLGVKRIVFYGIFAGLMSLAFTCRERHHKPNVEQTVVPEPEVVTMESPKSDELSFPEASEGTRLALVEPCGRCHKSTLESHKPAAVAIFDLDKNDQWHAQLTSETLEGLARRAKSNNSITDKERAFIEEFVAMKQARLQ